MLNVRCFISEPLRREGHEGFFVGSVMILEEGSRIITYQALTGRYCFKLFIIRLMPCLIRFTFQFTSNEGRRRISILLFSCGLTLAGFRVKLDSFNKLEIFEVEGEEFHPAANRS